MLKSLFRSMVLDEIEDPQKDYLFTHAEECYKVFVRYFPSFSDIGPSRVLAELKSYYKEFGNVPDITHLKKHFTLVDGNEEVLAFIESFEISKPMYLGNFKNSCKELYENNQLDSFKKVISDAFDIGGPGKISMVGKKKVMVKGIQEAFKFIKSAEKNFLDIGVESSLLAEIDAEKTEDPVYLIDHLYQRGEVYYLVGDDGAGKSYLVTEGFLNFSRGLPMWGFDNMSGKSGKVVYLEGDKNKRIAHSKLTTMGWDKEKDDLFLAYSKQSFSDRNTDIDISSEEGRKALETHVLAMTKPDVLILDTLTDYCSEIIKSEVVIPWMDALKALSRKYDMAIIIIHHPRKAGSEMAGDKLAKDDMYGSKFLSTKCSASQGVSGIWDPVDRSFKRGEGIFYPMKHGSIDFKQRKFKLISSPDPEVETPVGITYEFIAPPNALGRLETVETKVMELINGQSTKTMNTGTIKKFFTEYSESTLKRTLKRLVEQGSLKTLGAGPQIRYQIASISVPDMSEDFSSDIIEPLPPSEEGTLALLEDA